MPYSMLLLGLNRINIAKLLKTNKSKLILVAVLTPRISDKRCNTIINKEVPKQIDNGIK